MTASIPQAYLDLFSKKAFAHLATLLPDGSVQLTPVWVDFDGTHVRFNSARGRLKDRNVRRDPRGTLTIQDPDNPYRYLEVRGRVVEITESGADAHINRLSLKYTGNPVYAHRGPGEVRVLYKVEPHKATWMG